MPPSRWVSWFSPKRGSLLWRVLLPLCAIVGLLGVVAGVPLTALILEDDLSWTWLVAAMPLGGVLLLEFVCRFQGYESADGKPPAVKYRRPTAIEGIVLSGCVIILFGLLLDMGVRLRASLYSYLGYLTGVVIIFARRPRKLTKGDLLYLRWAWVPVIAIGVPLFIRIWKAKGLL